MRSFFLQLLLSFWVATIGIFIGATLIYPERNPGSFENSRPIYANASLKLAELAAQRYDAEGCAGIAILGPRIALANETGELMCGAAPSSEVREMILSMQGGTGAEPRRPVGRRLGTDWVEVREERLAGGRKWYLVQRTTYARRPWWPRLPNTAIPVSILVTGLFAYLLTRPVRALSRAFRSFSAGDLNVRIPVSPSLLGGVGGADVQTLMVDFNYMAERVKELVEAQKLLVRDISHELRSPLARLRVALELAREDASEHLPALDRVEIEADRVNALIGEMLTLSLMESTRQLPRVESFAIADLFEDLLPDMIFEAEARGCEVRSVGMDTAVRIEGQQEMLRRALENIIRNAIRYTPAGEAIEVEMGREGSVSTDAGTEEMLTISVRDRGPGVPEASLEQIFRPFYRVDMSRQGSTGGFGVGLAIAERAVHLHKGRIKVANRAGGGFIVEVILPMARVQEQGQAG